MYNDQPFPVLNTARLRLRKPLQKDAGPLLEVSRNDAVMQYYGMSSFKSKVEALAEIAWFNRIFACAQGIRWVITEQGGGQYIGDIGFSNHVSAHSRAEIGFKLAHSHWRKGIMAEALEPVLEYGFTEMQLNRTEAVVDPGNTACLSLLKRAGFVQEGLLREYEHEAKGYVDLVMLSLLKRDRQVSSEDNGL
jgi:[ribosomal protein S5]-alanine N-acetyltransferase